MTCPTFDDLLAAREASPARSLDAVREHLATGCPRCVRRNQLLAAVEATLGAAPLDAVPAELHLRALDLGRNLGSAPRATPAASGAGIRGRVRSFVGALLADLSAAPPTALALRGQGATDRHLLMRAGPFDIDLARMEDGSVVGNVLPTQDDAPSLADGLCGLYGDGAPFEAPLRANGDFHFEGVPAAAYDLVLESSGLRLLVPDVDLQAPDDPRREE